MDLWTSDMKVSRKAFFTKKPEPSRSFSPGTLSERAGHLIHGFGNDDLLGQETDRSYHVQEDFAKASATKTRMKEDKGLEETQKMPSVDEHEDIESEDESDGEEEEEEHPLASTEAIKAMTAQIRLVNKQLKVRKKRDALAKADNEKRLKAEHDYRMAEEPAYRRRFQGA